MSGQLGDLVISLSADIARFRDDMGKAQQTASNTADGIANAFAGVHASISKIGELMVAVAAGAGFAKLINSASNWNDEARKMALTMGTTTENASIMNVALHSLGIGQDSARQAALALTRSLEDGGTKFSKWGISVNDANGNLKAMPQLMADVNQKLLDTKSGTDRNVIALDLYKKSWKETSEILRYTPEVFQEAEKTAKRLHLVVGPEGVAQSLAYKKGIHEVELVAESFAIQLGNRLLPAINSVNTGLAHVSTDGANLFGDGISWCILQIQDFTVHVAAGIDKISLFGKHLADNFKDGVQIWNPDALKASGAEYQRQLEIVNKTEDELIAKNKAAMAIKPAVSADPLGGTVNPDTLKKNNENYNAALMAQVAYKKAAEEAKAAITKAAVSLEEQQNQFSYNLGITSLKEYLDKKHELTEKGLTAELAAKKKELADAQAAVGSLVNNGNEAQIEKANADALRKVEVAKKAVTEAQEKLTAAERAGMQENITATKAQQDNYKQIDIQLLSMTGHEAEAAQKQAELDASSVARTLLKTEALRGTKGAVEALAEVEKMAALNTKTAQLNEKQRTEEAAQNIAVLLGNYQDELVAQIKLKDIEIERVKNDPKLVEYLKLQREELEKMKNPLTAIVKGFDDMAKEWKITTKTMLEASKDFATGNKDALSNTLFQFMHGEIKSMGDAFESLGAAMVSVFEKAIAEIVAKWMASGIIGMMSGNGVSGFSVPTGLFSGDGGGSGGNADGWSNPDYTDTSDTLTDGGGYATGGVTGYGKLDGRSLDGRDNLYIGTVDGKQIIAQGGEYIMPPDATAKYYPLLERMRADSLGFAAGGTTSNVAAGSSGGSYQSLLESIAVKAGYSLDSLRNLIQLLNLLGGQANESADAIKSEATATSESMQATKASTTATSINATALSKLGSYAVNTAIALGTTALGFPGVVGGLLSLGANLTGLTATITSTVGEMMGALADAISGAEATGFAAADQMSKDAAAFFGGDDLGGDLGDDNGDDNGDGQNGGDNGINGGDDPGNFASGGIHRGGWRMIGERGPELEYTMPSRIINNTDTNSILSGLDKKQKTQTTNVTIPVYVGNDKLTELILTITDGVATARQRQNVMGRAYI